MEKYFNGRLAFYLFPCLADHEDVVHAVLTRRGSVSQGPYASLNLGYPVGDDPQTIRVNHQRVCDALQVRGDSLVSAHLVHRDRMGVVREAWDTPSFHDTGSLITTEEFYSHRVENGRTGRFGLAIGLRG